MHVCVYNWKYAVYFTRLQWPSHTFGYEWRCISCLNHYIYARYNACSYKHDRLIYCHIDVTRVSDLMSYMQGFVRRECAAVTCVLVTALPFGTQCVLQYIICILHTRTHAIPPGNICVSVCKNEKLRYTKIPNRHIICDICLQFSKYSIIKL